MFAPLPKIVMAPVNIAGQPLGFVRELRRRGVDISLLQYGWSSKGHRFGYETDRFVDLTPGRTEVQLKTLRSLLAEGTGIFHFWLRSLLFSDRFADTNGLDLPLIRQYGRRVAYRFTGEDVRLKSTHMKVNPFNAHRYGYVTKTNEEQQRRYHDLLRENVDIFLVGDPELQEFWPEARIVPRAIDLTAFAEVGPVSKERPLVIHAPSNPAIKGTQFVRAAVDALQAEGMSFDYEELTGHLHADAVATYARADVIIDQLHIGWYGVLAVEGMALGKTVICYVRQEPAAKLEEPIPMLNANPETIKDVLRAAIGDYEQRVDIGRRARAFVERVHDIRKVADRLIDIYRSLEPARPDPGPYRTLDRLRDHVLELEQHVAEATVSDRLGQRIEEKRARAVEQEAEIDSLRAALKVAETELRPYRALEEQAGGGIAYKAKNYSGLEQRFNARKERRQQIEATYRDRLETQRQILQKRNDTAARLQAELDGLTDNTAGEET